MGNIALRIGGLGLESDQRWPRCVCEALRGFYVLSANSCCVKPGTIEDGFFPYSVITDARTHRNGAKWQKGVPGACCIHLKRTVLFEKRSMVAAVGVIAGLYMLHHIYQDGPRLSQTEEICSEFAA